MGFGKLKKVSKQLQLKTESEAKLSHIVLDMIVSAFLVILF